MARKKEEESGGLSDFLHLDSTIEAWKPIIRDIAPGFLKDRKHNVDKEVERMSKLKARQDKLAGITRRS
jgi:hypothetical protein